MPGSGAPPTPDGLWGWAALALYVVAHAFHLIWRHARQGLRQSDLATIERRLDEIGERVARLEGKDEARG